VRKASASLCTSYANLNSSDERRACAKYYYCTTCCISYWTAAPMIDGRSNMRFATHSPAGASATTHRQAPTAHIIIRHLKMLTITSRRDAALTNNQNTWLHLPAGPAHPVGARHHLQPAPHGHQRHVSVDPVHPRVERRGGPRPAQRGHTGTSVLMCCVHVPLLRSWCEFGTSWSTTTSSARPYRHVCTALVHPACSCTIITFVV
jgi:hypothetical protein